MTSETKQLVRNIHKALILSHAYMFETAGYSHWHIVEDVAIFMHIKLKYKSSSEYYDISVYSSLPTSVSVDLAAQHYIEYHT